MLSGTRVLDLTDERGALAGKILGDLGADVLKVEPPGGCAARRRGPFLAGVPGTERSLGWLAMNTSKRSVVIDLEDDAGRASFRALADVADVILETDRPGAMAARGLGFASFEASNPGLVYCAITPFGQTGPHAEYRAGDLGIVAMGGNALLTGPADAAPLRCSQPTAHFHACPEAALGVVMALFGRAQSGRGGFVDVSMHECQLGTLITGAGQYALTGRLGHRSGGKMGRTREIWPAKDGQISFGLRGGAARIPNLIATVEYMAECGMAPDWLQSFDWQTYSPISASDEDLSRLESAFGAFFASKTMRELYDQALRRRILLAPCNDAREILAQPQLRSRDLFRTLEYPELGVALEHPDFFARASRSRIGIRSAAPRLGQHKAGDIVAQWSEQRAGTSADGAGPETETETAETETEAERGAAESGGIFAGLKILELGSGAAGPVATRYFGEQGATVIRIESGVRPDFLRMLHVTAANRSQPDILEQAPMFVLLNPNKQSLTLNMKDPDAVAIVKRLVEWADVVSENFAPGVMTRWGLSWEDLAPINPRLVMVSGCLFGQTGPQRTYPGFGGQGSAISGFNHLTGWPDRDAHGPYATITDSLAPRYVATAVAAALIERDRSGRGQYIDVSQIETGVYSLSEIVVRYSANEEVETRRGNSDEFAAPHGVYPCLGEDRWISIAVYSDDDWRRLVAAMDRPAWAADPALETTEGRLAVRDEIDRQLGEYTSTHERHPLMEQLQRAGVAACVVQDFDDLQHDAQLEARGHFVTQQHAHLGPLRFERSGFRLSQSPGGITSPGPTLGQHNRQILGDLLGIPDDEIDRLIDAKVIA